MFHSYFETLPATAQPLLGIYWTERQHACVFGRGYRSSSTAPTSLTAFRAAWSILREERPTLPLHTVTPNVAEYMYAMVLTRGFGECLVPVLDLANHDPLQAVPPFTTNRPRPQSKTQTQRRQTQQTTHILVATQNMSAGTPVYNSYGHHLAVDQLFASYGYLPTMAVLVTAPSLTNMPLFRQLCIGAEMQFFGPHVPDSVVVSARYHAQEQTTTLRPGRPTQLTLSLIHI